MLNNELATRRADAISRGVGVTTQIFAAKAENVIVADASLSKDPEQSALIEAYDKLAAPIASRQAGSVSETLSRVPNAAGESALGDVIADAQLAATKGAKAGGAVIALTNPGGIRTDIAHREDGKVTFADLFASQPFRNQLVTLTLTGQALKEMLEQQWLDPKRPRILQVSKGFSYAWDAAKAFGERVLADRMALDGKPIEPSASYRVTVNDYLAGGGDGFSVAKQGSARQYGIYDADALFAFFRSNGRIAPLAPARILRLN